MGKNTILCEVRARDLAAPADGPIYTCLSLTWTYCLDGAGEYTALFPARDPKLRAALLKDSLLRFEVGGKHVITGIVNRRKRRRGRTKDTLQISGPCILGGLAENTVGNLELTDGAGAGVNDGPDQVLDAAAVSNNTFTLDTSAGYATTLTDVYRKFSGESGLSALIKIAEQIGEHFRAATDGTLKVVWLRTDTPECPIRLVDNGGPSLHRNRSLAIIEDIESDENAERSINRIYPFGAGQDDARLTLRDATLSMPSGYTMDTANNYIEFDAGQVYPSTRRSVQKSWPDISVVDNSVEALIRVTTEAAAGATSIDVEALEVPIPSGAVLDVNGEGLITVTVTSDAAEGATSLAVAATSDIIFDFDRLLYSVPIDPANYESAANALASAALAYLGRLADPTRMKAYRITARNVPDTVTVGMLIPVVSQANGFEIDDNLIIREITRTVASSGRAPVQLRVSVQDWYETDEATEIARAIEEGRVARASAQPIAATSVTGGVTPGDIADLGGASAEEIAAAVVGSADIGAPVDDDKFAGVDSVTGLLGWFDWATIKTAMFSYLSAFFFVLAGKSGGQTAYGGTDSGDDLTLQSTSHATKGQLNMPDNTIVYGDGGTFLQVFFNAAAGAVADFLWQTAGSNRWIMRKDATAESGGDVGSNWILMSRTDAGGAKVSVIIGERNGNVGFGGVFPLARVHVLQTTLGQPVLRLQSTSAGDDPTLDVLQNRIITTNATLTTLHTFAIPANNTVLIDCQVFARRTGGTAGTADDGAWYHKKSAYTTKAGVVTLLFQVIHDTDYEDVAAWDCDLNISGTNVLLQVTGAANTNITWHLFKAEVAMMSA